MRRRLIKTHKHHVRQKATVLNRAQWPTKGYTDLISCSGLLPYCRLRIIFYFFLILREMLMVYNTNNQDMDLRAARNKWHKKDKGPKLRAERKCSFLIGSIPFWMMITSIYQRKQLHQQISLKIYFLYTRRIKQVIFSKLKKDRHKLSQITFCTSVTY